MKLVASLHVVSELRRRRTRRRLGCVRSLFWVEAESVGEEAEKKERKNGPGSVDSGP